MADDLSGSALFLQAEFGRAWQTHQARLLRMLERRIGPDQRSRFGPDDVLGDAAVAALRRWPEYHRACCDAKREGRPVPIGEYPWLYRITLDALIEAWRREHRKSNNQHLNVPYPDRSSQLLSLNIVSDGTKPEEALARQELREQVRRALEALPSRQREILSMHRLEEMEVKEIAEALELPLHTVYREIRKGVELIAKTLRTLNHEGV